jgi:Autographiviridae endonuclease VII
VGRPKLYLTEEARKEAKILQATTWAKNNPERRLEITRKSYQKNRARANAATKRWRDNNPIGVKDQNYRQYGMTYEKYLELFAKQNGLCALCGKPPTEKLLVVDHDHQNNKVRGLLHRSCNAALGIFGDSVKGLEIAIKYLKRTTKCR